MIGPLAAMAGIAGRSESTTKIWTVAGYTPAIFRIRETGAMHGESAQLFGVVSRRAHSTRAVTPQT